MFQFFNLLTRFHRIDEDFFTNCAIGVRASKSMHELAGLVTDVLSLWLQPWSKLGFILDVKKHVWGETIHQKLYIYICIYI